MLNRQGEYKTLLEKEKNSTFKSSYKQDLK